MYVTENYSYVVCLVCMCVGGRGGVNLDFSGSGTFIGRGGGIWYVAAVHNVPLDTGKLRT